MTLDANGIWIFDESEAAAPVSTMLNRLGNSVSDAVAPLTPPSSWVAATPWLNSGFVSNGLQVRTFGALVFWRGRLGPNVDWGAANSTNAAMSGIPPEYSPSVEMGWVATPNLNSASLRMQVRITAAGALTVRADLASRTEQVFINMCYLAN
jgi:hypothetical protein